MLIDHITWKTKTKDYSQQLARVKAEMGTMYKGHPGHNPIEYPWMYEPWQIGRMLLATDYIRTPGAGGPNNSVSPAGFRLSLPARHHS